MVEFRRVIVPDEVDALCEFDRRAFHAYPADLFTPQNWQALESYWMVVDGKTIGCSAFRRHSDDEGNSRPGTLNISSTGILPEYQGRGLGRLQKEWQIEHAKKNGFTRMITCMRESNERIIRLNKRLGFRPIKLRPHYYNNPDETAIVMELQIGVRPDPGEARGAKIEAFARSTQKLP